jgi:hypothetical protein
MHTNWKSRHLTIALALGLGAAGSTPIALAGNADVAPSASPAAGEASSGGASSPAKANAPAPDPNSPLLLELRDLKATVQAQADQVNARSQELESERAALGEELQRIAALEAKLGVAPAASTASTAAPAAAASAALPAANAASDPGQSPSGALPPPIPTMAYAGPLQTAGPAAQQGPQPQVPQDWSTRVGNIEDRLKDFGPFAFSGDFRLRGEPFFGGPANQSLDQTRERFRLRFNVTAKLNDDISGGFSLASGDINDPTSTNQTVGDFYTRKAIALDKAYVDYTPHQFKNLTLIGGKFSYPWYNTELTWDKDLNPEGLAQTLTFNLNTPGLKKISFIGFELPFTQVAGVSLTNQSLVSSVTYGGQVQTNWQLGLWLKFGAYAVFYDFVNSDPIALALARASAKNPQTPLTGLLPLGTGNTVQNSITTTTATDIITTSGTAYPTGVTNITNAQFASKFALVDGLARFDVRTPSDRWPIALIGDYVQNTEACANVETLKGAPANTASVEYSQSTNFACNPHQRRGYWAEAQAGRATKRGDWQFDYTRIFIEREAVLSNFDYSDIRQGSNVSEHRAMVLYQLYSNVQLSFTGLFGRPLNFGSSKPPEDYLKRLQFDLIYSF